MEGFDEDFIAFLAFRDDSYDNNSNLDIMKKKILFILPGFTFGGTVFSTLNMILFLKDKYDVTVFPMLPYGPVREKYEEAKVNILDGKLSIMAVSSMLSNEEPVLLNRVKLDFFKILNHIAKCFHLDFQKQVYKCVSKRIMKNGQYDYVCSCSEGISTEFASYFIQAKRIAWFRTEYSIWKDQLTLETLEHNLKLYPKFDYVVPVSKTTGEDFVKYFSEMAERVIPIHNIQKDENIAEKAKEHIEESFSKDFFNIVSVGRIARQKQFHKIPAIAHKLRDELDLPIRWYIVGGEGTGSYGELDKLNAELDKYDNREYVICLGDRLNPYPYIKSADLLVNTSYYEACPRVVAEAQILHTPVICSDFSSAYEFVQNDVNGYIDTIENLWQPIAKMIQDKEAYQRIKSTCETYKIDNGLILEQLQQLFG